ncbi:NAD(P)-dependent oxidoreductase [Agromyces sp. Root81]|uniref:dTDP-4-dehydrorhamnose reductase n=1 Tax=Agromyces sp. Root81 TaxID=1736601 RepID=UPI0006FDC99E|nr:dTDP-4-dehydrorhamnose reductase [Agromyces sp. Root81]KRC60483.1 NAD(P)-dependent oxidoreductase [Agromyces sp. Root81]
MRTLITGASGMLGRDLQRAFSDRDVTALDRNGLDVTDASAVLDAVAGHDVVVNAAAYTRVDAAESDEDTAYAVNALGAKHLAQAASVHGARLVQVSTDYVFDGTSTTPYPEDAPLSPVSAYGRTKAAGEALALAENPGRTYVVRTAWLYGEHGPNFAATMLRLASERESWNVVDDQIGQPTWSFDLARKIAELVGSGAPGGIFHGTSSGRTSWFGFAQEILRLAGLDPERISPIPSSSYPTPAPRPSFSVLGHDAWGRIGLAEMRDWRTAVAASGVASTMR